MNKYSTGVTVQRTPFEMPLWSELQALEADMGSNTLCEPHGFCSKVGVNVVAPSV